MLAMRSSGVFSQPRRPLPGNVNAPPTLFTKISMRPNRSLVAAMSSLALSGEPTSPTQTSASAPKSRSWSRTRSAPGACRSAIITLAPSSANRLAVARPWPWPPPVTIAILPRRRFPPAARGSRTVAASAMSILPLYGFMRQSTNRPSRPKVASAALGLRLRLGKTCFCGWWVMQRLEKAQVAMRCRGRESNPHAPEGRGF